MRSDSDTEHNRGPADAYEVGYRKPPRHARFRPGQSGNPRGRPKGARSLATVVASAIAERVTVAENGKRRRIPKLDAAIKQLTNRAAIGDVRALQLLLTLVQATEQKQAESAPSCSGDADLTVLNEVMRRLSAGR